VQRNKGQTNTKVNSVEVEREARPIRSFGKVGWRVEEVQAEVFPDEWLQLNRKSRIPIRAYSAEQRKWLSEFKTSSHCTRWSTFSG
jgi:hypothetical protein